VIGATVDLGHRPRGSPAHVVEHTRRPRFRALGELVEGVDLKLDLDEMSGMGRARSSAGAPRRQRDGCP